MTNAVSMRWIEATGEPPEVVGIPPVGGDATPRRGADATGQRAPVWCDAVTVERLASALEAVSLEELDQIRAIHPALASGAGHVAGGALHEPLEVAALELGEDGAARVAVAHAENGGDGVVAAGASARRDASVDRRRLAHHDHRLDDVAELANVAGPAVRAERGHRVGRDELVDRAVVALLAEEVLDQERDVLGALAERRHREHHDRDAVVEVEAEAPVVDLGAQIAVRRGDEAHVDRDLVPSADAAEPAPLERAEQRGLERWRELADLVEEERAAVRALERALVPTVGAGERALLVAEELARDERRRERAAVDDDERAARARALVVERACDQLLAGAGLAHEQHRRVGLRGAADPRHQAAHHGRAASQAGPLVVLVELDGDAAAVADAERGVPDAEDGARTDDAALDAGSVEERSVGGAVIREEHAVVPALELEVIARDRRVGEDEIVAVRGTDREPFALGFERRAAVRALDDLDDERANREPRGPAGRLGRLRRHERKVPGYAFTVSSGARLPFRLKLLLLFALVAVVPLVAVGVLLIDVNADAVATSSRELQIAIAGDVARTVQGEVRDVTGGLDAVARALTDTTVDEPSRLRMAATRVEADDRLDVVSVYGEDGAWIDTLREADAEDVEMPERLETALRTRARRGGSSVGSVSVAAGGPRLLVVVPIRAGDRVTGYVASRAQIRNVQARVARLAEAHLASAEGSIVVVDEELRVIAHPDLERAHALAPAEEGILRASDVGEGRADVARSGEYVAENGEMMVGTVAGIEGVPWAVVVRVPKRIAYASLTRMRTIVIATLVITVLLALLSAFFVARRITAPIERLGAFAGDLAARRFDRRVTVDTRDELSVLADAMSSAAAELEASEDRIRTEAAIRADLGRYLPAELVEKVVAREQDMELGGRKLEVTVLFADVVAFTPLTERLAAEDTVKLLNELFTVLTEIVFRHGGTVDKFVGDCVMAIWGAPSPQADHARRALLAAEDMLRFLEAANAGWREKWGVTVQLAIGVNSGDAVVGNVGSETRMEYTAIGDVVNVAARLEAIARPQQILITGATRAAAGDGFDYVEVGRRELSGRAEPVDLYEVRA